MLIQNISRTTRLHEEEIRRIAENASARYKIYEIPKRNSQEKRVICHPSRELKALQRWISRVIIARFPIHDSATAYKIGGGIRENAYRHRKTLYTNRYDFSNFFPSFSEENIKNFVSQKSEFIGMNLSEEDINFIGKVLCRKGRLTIGAPSSPPITNAMMFEFDRNFYDYCSSRNLIYTRYADDIYVSSYEPNALNNIETKIAFFKRGIEYLSLRLNRRKTVYLSKKYRRSITGVIITPDHQLSIGRSRKKEIKSLIHQWINGKLDSVNLFYMRGLLAFSRDIEPPFENSMRIKYGNKVIDELLRSSDLGEIPDIDFKYFNDET